MFPEGQILVLEARFLAILETGVINDDASKFYIGLGVKMEFGLGKKSF